MRLKKEEEEEEEEKETGVLHVLFRHIFSSISPRLDSLFLVNS